MQTTVLRLKLRATTNRGTAGVACCQLPRLPYLVMERAAVEVYFYTSPRDYLSIVLNCFSQEIGNEFSSLGLSGN